MKTVNCNDDVSKMEQRKAKALSFEIGELYSVGDLFYQVAGVVHDDEKVFGSLLNDVSNTLVKDVEHKFSQVTAQWYKL